MLTIVLSGPAAGRSVVVEQLLSVGATVDQNPVDPTGGFPPGSFGWITCEAKSLGVIEPVLRASGWTLRLQRRSGLGPRAKSFRERYR